MFLHRFTVILLGFGLLNTLVLAQTSAWEDKNRAGEKAFQAGKLADAQELFSAALREAQQFGPKDVRQAPILNNLALVAFVQNNFTTAEEDFDQAVSVIEAARGPEDLLLLPIFDNITRLYVKQWAFDNAIRTSWRSCHIREKKLGVEHADTAANLNQLATLYFDSVRLLPHEQGDATQSANDVSSAGDEIQDDSAKLSMAESLYQRVLAANERRFGTDSVRLVDVIESLARVSRAEGNPAPAQQFYQRAVSILETSFGPEELRLAEPLRQMAELKTEDGNYPEADKLYERAVHITEQKLGPKDASLGPILTGYATLLDRMQKPEQAKELTARASALPAIRTVSAPAINQNAPLTPYVLRFERAVFDRYSGLHQTCLLVRADGSVRIEERLKETGGDRATIVPAPKSPDGMGDVGQPEERLDDRPSTGPLAPKVFEDSLDSNSLQQLKAILSAKDLRDIRGIFPRHGAEDYYGTEKLAVSVPREDGVQSFGFPDIATRQRFENTLKPLFKWASSAEKHRGNLLKGATATNCSPESPQSAVVASGTPPPKPAQPTGNATTGIAPSVPVGSSSTQIDAKKSETPTIKVAVNLVPVRAVVRDAHDHAIGNLRQEDFQLLDNRQPQVISRFSVEQAGAEAHKETTGNAPAASPEAGKGPASETRYVAYLFDDVHLKNAEMLQMRDAATRQLAALPSSDRAAIFTTSGEINLDFTDDHAKLQDTLTRVQPRPIGNSGAKDCPDIDPYMAYLIWDKKDEDALGTATMDALVCGFGNDAKRAYRAAEAMARSAAQQQVAAADIQNQIVLRAFRNTLLKLAPTPGQHLIVLVSPGFVTPGREQDFAKLIDYALRNNIVISSLDVRGLYRVDSVADRVQKTDYDTESAAASSEVLASLAEGTGGTFFHNNNSMAEGFSRTAATPNYSYLLGFSPNDLKPDGSFHSLSVSVKSSEKVTVKARKGYFAPKAVAQNNPPKN